MTVTGCAQPWPEAAYYLTELLFSAINMIVTQFPMDSKKMWLLLFVFGMASPPESEAESIGESAGASGAVPILIANHSFENPVQQENSYTVNVMPGWTGSGTFWHVANPGDSWFPGTSAGSGLPNPIDGFNIAGINTGASIRQDLAAVVEQNAAYSLTMLTGHRLGSPFGSPTVRLLAGGQLLAQAVPPSPAEGMFASFELIYTSPPSGSMIGQPLRIEIQSSGTDAQVWIDNLNLNFVAVPEPSTIALGMCSGILAMLLRHRRTSSH